jgi:imidazole glycerol-phosphate synthase subunit HisH
MSSTLRVTVFDYGAGNLHSIGKAIAGPGVSVRAECDPHAALDTDVLVLPGVGNFGVASQRVAPAREAMRDAIRQGLPTLGVCLGMQLLFDASDEAEGRGLGVFAGRVTKLAADRTPQIGWNSVDESCDALFERAPLDVAYYANGFACRPADASCVVAWTTHDGDRFPAAIRSGNTLGVQFHPEKSSAAGVCFLRAFLDEVAR